MRRSPHPITGEDLALACVAGMVVDVIGLMFFRRTVLDRRAYSRLMVVLITH